MSNPRRVRKVARRKLKNLWGKLVMVEAPKNRRRILKILVSGCYDIRAVGKQRAASISAPIRTPMLASFLAKRTSDGGFSAPKIIMHCRRVLFGNMGYMVVIAL